MITQEKFGILSLSLSRKPGVKWNTAKALRSKPGEVMRERDGGKMLEGEIEMDNAYIGGKKEGKSGRGSENKTPFIAVVEKRENRPQRIHLRCVARYLAEFEYRFNRRSKMADMIERLAYVSLRSPSKNI